MTPGQYSRTQEIAEEALRRWKEYALGRVKLTSDPSEQLLKDVDRELSLIEALKKEVKAIAAKRRGK